VLGERGKHPRLDPLAEPVSVIALVSATTDAPGAPTTRAAATGMAAVVNLPNMAFTPQFVA
jgi:hypothetical protein